MGTKRKISYKLIMLSQVQKLFFAAVLTIIILFYGYKVTLAEHDTEYARAFSEPNDGLEPNDTLDRVDRANLPAGAGPEGTVNLDSEENVQPVEPNLNVISQADEAGVNQEIQTQDLANNVVLDSAPASISEPSSDAMAQNLNALTNVEHIAPPPLDDTSKYNQESPYNSVADPSAQEGTVIGDNIQFNPPAQPVQNLYSQVSNAQAAVNPPAIAVQDTEQALPPPAEMPAEMAALLASINGDIADAKAREEAGQAPLEEGQNA